MRFLSFFGTLSALRWLLKKVLVWRADTNRPLRITDNACHMSSVSRARDQTTRTVSFFAQKRLKTATNKFDDIFRRFRDFPVFGKIFNPAEIFKKQIKRRYYLQSSFSHRNRNKPNCRFFAISSERKINRARIYALDWKMHQNEGSKFKLNKNTIICIDLHISRDRMDFKGLIRRFRINLVKSTLLPKSHEK